MRQDVPVRLQPANYIMGQGSPHLCYKSQVVLRQSHKLRHEAELAVESLCAGVSMEDEINLYFSQKR